MSEVLLLKEAKSRKILERAMAEKTGVSFSYFAAGKWWRQLVVISAIDDDGMVVRRMRLKKSGAAEVQTGQMAGVSIQYGFGRGCDHFVFDTIVDELLSEEELRLLVPERIDMIGRRSYFRVQLAEPLEVKAVATGRYMESDCQGVLVMGREFEGKLIDISAAGCQIAIDISQRPYFHSGDMVKIVFVPEGEGTPIGFNTNVRSVIPTVDSSSLCIGLEVVGLEASPEGRLTLSRLCEFISRLS
jgi:hypothetical protein